MARKPAQIEPAAPLKLPLEQIHWIGEPELRCGNCQHFKKRTAKERGDCHNLISGNWRVWPADAVCKRGWYPDVDRFPIHVLMGIRPADAQT